MSTAAGPPGSAHGGARSFRWPVRVYYEDTDAAGIVYYANYLRYLERARTEWLRSRGFDHGALRARHGLLFTVARVHLDYRRPALLDERLQVTVTLARQRAASLELTQSVQREDGDGALVCEGAVTIACVDAASLRPRRIPAEIGGCFA